VINRQRQGSGYSKDKIENEKYKKRAKRKQYGRKTGKPDIAPGRGAAHPLKSERLWA